MSQEQIQVPKGWKKTTVGKEIELAYGKNLPKPERIEGDFPVYGSNGIVGSHNKFLIDFPSIVIGRKGTVGSIHKTKAKFWPTDVSFYVKINDVKKLQLNFVYYLLLYLNLPKYGQSGPKSGLNRNDVYKIEFILPSLPIQKKIIQKLDDILGQLEEKKKAVFSIIDQNKEKIDLFEKNWFSYLIDREIEHHPQRKEWEVIPLKDITNALGDGIHSTPNYVQNSEFYFINGNNLRNGSIVITQKTKMVAQTEYQKYKLDLNENTVLLSINGTIGNLSFYRNEKVILGKSACYINSNNKLNVEFLFYLLQSNLIKNYFRKELTKTSIPNLSLKSVRMAPIALPPLPIQKQIVQNIKNAEEKFKSQKSQFENIKENYENSITYVNHIQSSILDTAFSGKLVQ